MGRNSRPNYLEDGQIRIQTRNKNDVTGQFPELQEAATAFKADNGIFDTEIVCLDVNGKPCFQDVIKRVRTQDKSKINNLRRTHPIKCYVFDVLYLNDEPLVQFPFLERYSRLETVIEGNKYFCLDELFEDGEILYRAIQEHGMEGIVAKKKDSPYLIGRRSSSWQKVKIRQKAYCAIIGYTKGSGSRERYIGSLHVAEEKDRQLVYRGKVGTGFSDSLLKEIHSDLTALQEVEKHAFAPADKETVWVEPELVGEVSFVELTSENVFRAPVFEKYIGSFNKTK